MEVFKIFESEWIRDKEHGKEENTDNANKQTNKTTKTNQNPARLVLANGLTCLRDSRCVE